jgi:hypothetical protein
VQILRSHTPRGCGVFTLCAFKNEAVAHYALDGLPNTVLATEYRLALPDEAALVAALTGADQERKAQDDD